MERSAANPVSGAAATGPAAELDAWSGAAPFSFPCPVLGDELGGEDDDDPESDERGRRSLLPDAVAVARSLPLSDLRFLLGRGGGWSRAFLRASSCRCRSARKASD